MQRRRGWKGAWLVVLSSAVAALGGCEGGQTGDNGNSGEENCEVSRRRLSSTEADDVGFPASQAIAALVAGRTREGETVWLTGPPSIWTNVGATSPPDRSLPAQLFVEATSIEEATYTCGAFEERRALEVGIELRLETSEPQSILTGRGRMVLSSGSLATEGAEAGVGIDGVVDDGFCLLRAQGADGPELRCDYFWASSRCLEPAERSALPAVAGLPLAGLVELVNAVSPLSLRCDDGRTVSASFGLLVPDSACIENEVGSIPAVMNIVIEELSVPADSRSALLNIKSNLPCQQVLTEEALDVGGECAAVTVSSFSLLDASPVGIHMTIRIDEEQRRFVEVVATGPLGQDGYSPHCRGGSELD